MKYFISFTEEGIQNPDYAGYIGGRIEVYGKGVYNQEEIRFLTKNVDKFNKFREHWDFKDIGESELKKLRTIAEQFLK